VAIQLIITKELGLNRTQNPWQGSFALDTLTDLVEEAVYREFDRISERGGVLGAMETMYQRGRIQEESLYYETLKHDGRLPIVGVNTFLGSDDAGEIREAELIRSTEQEKRTRCGRCARSSSAAPSVVRQRLRACRPRPRAAATFRGTHGDREGRVARQHLARAVRRRRSVPTQHVNCAGAARRPGRYGVRVLPSSVC